MNNYFCCSKKMDMFEKMRLFMKKITLIQFIHFIALMVISIIALFIPSLSNFNDDRKYNSADIAWITKTNEGLGVEASQRVEKYLQNRLLVKKEWCFN